MKRIEIRERTNFNRVFVSCKMECIFIICFSLHVHARLSKHLAVDRFAQPCTLHHDL